MAESSELSKATYDAAADDIRAATTGKHGLLTRSIELDADALVVRATVLTYRWIDELQEAAYKTLGTIAGRAIGYLAPGVALGGAIVSAGLIETDALDRDGIADYLNDLAEANPDLMDHVTSGGGGLVEAMQLRSLLTSGLLAGDRGRLAAAGGLRAIGVDPFAGVTTAAVRDVAGPVVAAEPEPVEAAVIRRVTLGPALPRGADHEPVPDRRRSTVHRVGDAPLHRLPAGPDGASHRADGRRLRLVGGDPSSYAAQAVAAIESAVAGHRRRHRDAGRLRLGRRGRGRDRRRRPVRGASPSTRSSWPAPRRRRCRPCRGYPDAVARGPRRSGRPARFADQCRCDATGWWSSSTAGRGPRAATSRRTCGRTAPPTAPTSRPPRRDQPDPGPGYLAGEHQGRLHQRQGTAQEDPHDLQ